MKLLFLILTLTVLPAFGEHPAGGSDIALYTQFRQPPPASILAGLQSELRSIMAPAGLEFQWRDLHEADGKQVSAELAVVTFKGRCDAARQVPFLNDVGALGWTNISDGMILPFATVDCDAIHGFIQKELLLLRPEERLATFGRALGRVLAHELYHILANTRRHGSDGIGRECYSVRELMASSFQFDPKESAALKSNQARPVAASEEPDYASHRL